MNKEWATIHPLSIMHCALFTRIWAFLKGQMFFKPLINWEKNIPVCDKIQIGKNYWTSYFYPWKLLLFSVCRVYTQYLHNIIHVVGWMVQTRCSSSIKYWLCWHKGQCLCGQTPLSHGNCLSPNRFVILGQIQFSRHVHGRHINVRIGSECP